MNVYSKTLFLLFFSLVSTLTFAQTTAGISGQVNDANGAGLPGAVVKATHEPTGTVSTAVTTGEGRYSLRQQRVGGPYTLVVTMSGFQTQSQKDIFLKLGENKKVDFTLRVEAVEETMVVTAKTNPLINPSRTGGFSNVTTDSIEKLPSISRSIQDLARTNPNFVQDPETNSLSVGGRNNRYNSMQIDGSANTDQFGLATSNTPGGQTESQPISLDSIAELELIVSPYDVRYGGFTGGGINAVTRTGQNKMDGSVYYFYRDTDFVGDGVNDTPFGEFENSQLGARVGGAIIKDKLFYFVNMEQNRQDQPSDWLINGQTPGGNNFGFQAEADEFLSIMQTVYNYNPGGYGEFTRTTDSDNVFVRFDWNINDAHRLTARHNFVDSNNHSRERSSTLFEFPDGFYVIENKTNSTVFQLNSVFGSVSNEARLNITSIRDNRGGPGDPFPSVDVQFGSGNNTRTFRAGWENFSHANALDQDLMELNDEVTFFTGNHTLTLGANFQTSEFSNLFIQDLYGNYTFRTLQDFRLGQPSRYQHSYSLTSDPLDRADVKVAQFGFYAGDEWQLTERLNLVLGVRGEVPKFDEPPTRNPVTEQAFGVATNQTADGNWLWSPRVGFNWDISGDGTKQLRGGVGVFSGRPIYVWISNNYSNTGVEFARIDATFSEAYWREHPNDRFFETDPLNQPRNLPPTSATSTEFNLIDPNFKYPQVSRTSLGYDQELGFFDLTASVEYQYTDTMEDVLYKDLNLQVVGTGPNGRAMMGRVNPTLGPAYYLTNTDKGYTWNGTYKLERLAKDGFGFMVSYTNGVARTMLDATSSRAVSNYATYENSGDPNNNVMSTSDFEIKHRYTTNVTYSADWWKGNPTTFALYYNIRSGRPFSYSYNGNANGDSNIRNDLVYVPNDASEVVLQNVTWEVFNAFIESQPGLAAYRGQIVPRNSGREPWNSLLDFRLAQDFSAGSSKFQFSIDIQNFGNLIDSDSGAFRRVGFNNLTVIQYRGVEAGTGKPILRLSRNADDSVNVTETLDQLSRWYAKMGLRWTF